VTERRWSGVVPVGLLVIALLIVWSQWVFSRVAPAETRSMGLQTQSVPVDTGEHLCERRVAL
jgi:hypothetical protein